MNSIRYSKQVVGVNTLAKYIPRICAQAGLSGNYTGHSGKAASITQMYDAGVEEGLIQERSGHRSIKCLLMYNRTTEIQKRQVSEVLNPSIAPPKDKVAKSSNTTIDNFLIDSEMDKELSEAASKFDNSALFSGNVYQNCTFNIYTSGKK